MNKIDLKLLKVLRKVFPKSKKKINNLRKLEINAFKEWDSIGNLNLLLEVEKEFNFKFTMDEMSEIKSIKQILNKINVR